MKKKTLKNIALILTALLLIFNMMPKGFAFATEGGNGPDNQAQMATQEKTGQQQDAGNGTNNPTAVNNGNDTNGNSGAEGNETANGNAGNENGKENAAVQGNNGNAGNNGNEGSNGNNDSSQGNNGNNGNDGNAGNNDSSQGNNGNNGNNGNSGNQGNTGNENGNQGNTGNEGNKENAGNPGGNGGGGTNGQGDENGNSKTNKYKVNFIRGCKPLADYAFFILNDGTRVDLKEKDIITLKDVETEEIDQVGAVLKNGEELLFEREDVIVESPKNENGTVVFKIVCETPQAEKSKIKLILKDCIGVVDGAWVVLKNGQQVKFKTLDDQLKIKFIELKDIAGVKVLKGNEKKLYLLEDPSVTEEMLEDGTIVITLGCPVQEPPVDVPDSLTVKVILGNCLGTIEKAALLLAGGETADFDVEQGMDELLLEVEDLQASGVEGLLLTIGGEEYELLLSDLDETELKIEEGMITIKLDCEDPDEGGGVVIDEPEVPGGPADLGDLTVKVILGNCLGAIEKAALLLTGGETVDFDVEQGMDEMLLQLENLQASGVEGLILTIGGEEYELLLSDLEETELTIEEGKITIMLSCEDTPDEGGGVVIDEPEVPGGTGIPAPEVPDEGTGADEEIIIPDNEVPGGGTLPQTGENSPIGYYMAGILLSIAGLGMIRTLRRKPL